MSRRARAAARPPEGAAAAASGGDRRGLGRLYEMFRRVNRTHRPEESTSLRLIILVSVLVAVAAAWASGAAPGGDAVLALLLLPLGAWLSYRRRGKDNTLIKLALTVGAALALMRFFGDVRLASSLDDTRAPLAALFLAVQVLHGFDLPQRRDLGFTLASSLALVALAGTSTHSGLFGALLIVYAAIGAVAMAGLQRSAARERADRLRDEHGLGDLGGGDPEPETLTVEHGAALARTVAASGSGLLRASGPVLLVGLLVFLLLPRSDTTRLAGLPFRGFPSLRLSSSLVTNPGVDGASRDQAFRDASDPPPTFNPAAYFGFAEYVDLRTVGELSDEPVLRVRARRPRFWRGMVFDVYTGLGWTRTAEEPPPTYGVPVHLGDQDGETPQRTDTLVQTVELLADTPNLLFAAADPVEVHIAGGSVNRFADGTITTGALMEEGIIYSVVSEIGITEPATLRALDGPIPADVVATYTQLPDDLPQRVHDLAAELTNDGMTPYEKAEAIQAWIGANTEYTLDSPPPPDAGDMVDHFLFESQQGWCEPIASSMVVLLRSAGVPARFATGFQPGDRNPITGVWDVKMSDAHAWVEAWVPGEGWVAFDPTGAVPAAVSSEGVPRIPLLEFVRWAGDRLVALVPGPVRDLGRAGIDAVRSHAPATGALAALTGALAAAALLGARRRREAAALAALSPFDRLGRLLEQTGLPRDDWQTPREYVRRIRLHRPDLPADALETLLEAEEQAHYAPHHPPPPHADTALARIEEHLVAREG